MNTKQFQADLIDWFHKEQRQLPWRENKNPYRILVSEIMLQQTRVDTVIPYFNRFMEWFPTPEAFANADEEKILKSWEGLGYYSRVRNLHAAIQEVVNQNNGLIPDTRKALAKLKGIGPYTAGAVLSIAYDKPEPAVDGNVMRVLARICEIDADIAQPTNRKQFEDKVRELVSHDDPSSFNQGLMELGALICTPTNPQCLTCPVNEHCQAFEKGLQNILPIKTKKKQTKAVHLLSVVVKNQAGELLIRKRPQKGLLAGLWEFPSYEVTEPTLEKLVEHFQKDFSIELPDLQPIAQFKHIFTHLTWHIHAYTVQILQKSMGGTWVHEHELPQYALPTPQQKIYEAFVLHENNHHWER